MQQRTRVKICGITSLNDAYQAINAGADALGFVFYRSSPRYIDPKSAAIIVNCLPAFVQSVGLFVNASSAEIVEVINYCPVQLLQFHGDESPEFCHTQANLTCKPFMKALAVNEGSNLSGEIDRFVKAGATAILLDAYEPGLYGGTGKVFDWTSWPKADIPLVLAGGLTENNVKAAISATSPYAVDVSGGVEVQDANGILLKGIKDSSKMRAFIKAVQESDSEQS